MGTRKIVRAAFAAFSAAFAAVSFGASVDHYVEYIEATGTQWILTDYTPSSTTIVEVDAARTSDASDQCLFCSRGNATGDRSYALFFKTSKGWRWDYKTTASSYGWLTVNVRGTHTCAPTGLFIDGQRKVTTKQQTFTPPNVMTIFAAYTQADGVTPTTVNTFAKVKLYRFVVRDGAAISRDLLPCVDTDGNAALYDRVTKKFYYNQGTGSFNVGSTITAPAKPYYMVRECGADGIDLDSLSGSYRADGLAAFRYGADEEYTVTGAVTHATIPEGGKFTLVGYNDRLGLMDSGLLDDTGFKVPIQLAGSGMFGFYGSSLTLGRDWADHLRVSWDADEKTTLRLDKLTVKDTSGEPLTFNPAGNIRVSDYSANGYGKVYFGQDGSRLTADFSHFFGCHNQYKAAYMDNRYTKIYIGGASSTKNDAGYANVILRFTDSNSCDFGVPHFSYYITTNKSCQAVGCTNTLTIAGPAKYCTPYIYRYGPEVALIRFANENGALKQQGDHGEMFRTEGSKVGTETGRYVLEGVDGTTIRLGMHANCIIGTISVVEFRGNGNVELNSRCATSTINILKLDNLVWNMKGDLRFANMENGNHGAFRVQGSNLPCGQGKGNVEFCTNTMCFFNEDLSFNSVTGIGQVWNVAAEPKTFTIGCDGNDCTYQLTPGTDVHVVTGANWKVSETSVNAYWHVVKAGTGNLTLKSVPPIDLDMTAGGDLILAETLALKAKSVKMASGTSVHVADGASYAYPIAAILSDDSVEKDPCVILERGGELVVGSDGADEEIDFSKYSGDASATIRKVGSNKVTLRNYGNFKGSVVKEAGAGEIIPNAPPAELTWSGAGADTLVTTKENWGLTTDTLLRGFKAIFATGGTTATVNADIPFSGIAFDQKAEGETGFTVEGPGKVAVGEDGISTAQPTAAGTNTYAISAPLEITKSQTWDIGATVVNNTSGEKFASTLAFTGPISSTMDGLKVTKTGWGDVYLYATNSTSTAVLGFSTTGRVYVAGNDAWGAAGSQLRVSGGGDVEFRGGTFSGDVETTIGTGSKTKLFASAKNTENAFNGTVTLNGAHRVSVGANSIMEFNNTFSCGGWTYVNGSKETTSIMRFNKTATFGSGQFANLTLDFRAPNNQLGSGDFNLKYGSSTVLLNCEYAWNTSNRCLIWAGATIDICGHNNKVGTLQILKGTVKNSGEKATLWTEANDATWTEKDGGLKLPIRISGDITGPTSLGKMGPETITITNRAISSTGDIIVQAGTLKFSFDASWTNAAEVIVNNATAGAGAVLEINQGKTFSKKVVVRLGNGGKLRVGGAEIQGASFMQKVAALYIDDVKVAPGRYSADGHDGTAKCDWMEGSGVLCIRGNGLMTLVL